MYTIPDFIEGMFTQAFGFPTDQVHRGPVNGEYLIDYVWITRLSYRNSVAILAGVSAFTMIEVNTPTETHRKVPKWKRGLLLLWSHWKSYEGGTPRPLPEPIDLDGQDFVGDALQTLCVLPTDSKGMSLGPNPDLPNFDLFVRSSVCRAAINCEGYNDTPGYKAFWDVLVHTVDRYLTLYDDPKLYQEIREDG